MPGTHFEWATSWRVNRYLSMLRPVEKTSGKTEPLYHLYLYARCDAKGTTGEAMTAGVYDSEAKKSVCHRSIKMEQIRGDQYKMIDMGSVPLKDTQYFWAAPARKHDGLDAVYIDRVVIVREK